MSWILFFIFNFSVSFSPAEEPPADFENAAGVNKIEADVLHEKYKNLVTRVLVRGPKNTDRKSQGTAFVVDANDGILMTSYRLVADKVTNASRYSVTVNYLNSEIPVDVIYVDIVTDLALLKTSNEVQFPDQIKIANLALSTTGEIIYSMGFPIDQKLNITIGSFVATAHIGYSKVSKATLALAPGMEGGPCFNDKGEVIGVNRALEKNSTNKTILTALSHIHSMLNNGRKTGSDHFYVSKIPLIDQVLYNLSSYEKLHKRTPSETYPEFKVEQINFSYPIGGIYCENTSGGIKKMKSLSCQNESIAYLGKNISAFSFTSDNYLNENHFGVGRSIDDAFEKKFADIEKELLGFVDRRPSSKSTEPKKSPTQVSNKYCSFHHIKNKKDTHLIARVCSLPIPNFPGIYVTFAKTDVIDSQQRRISFTSTIETMSMEKTASILNYFWNSIYEDKKN